MTFKQNLPLVFGILTTILLVNLPFLHWTGVVANNEETNLMVGIPEMIARNQLFASTIAFLICFLPVLLALLYQSRTSTKKWVIISFSFLILLIQIAGIKAIHLDFMIYNYGKVHWVLSFGYFFYLITQIGIGLVTLHILWITFINKGYSQRI